MRLLVLAPLLVCACATRSTGGAGDAEASLASAWARAGRTADGDAAPRQPSEGSEPAAWSLDAVLAGIEQANPTLRTAAARLEAARAVRREARASYVPELTLGYGYLATDEPAQAFGLLLNQEDLVLGPTFDATPGTTENWRKELRLDWPLFSPGRGQSLRSAEAGEEGARLAHDAVARRLLNAGVQAWIGLGAARALAEVAHASIAVVEQRLEQTRRRAAEGAALDADVLRLEVRLAETRQAAARSDLAVRTAESALNALMGRAPDAPIALAEGVTPPVGPDLPPDLAGLLERAAADRLDLRAAAWRARVAGLAGEARRAENLPRVDLFAAYDVDGDEPGIDTDLDSTSVGVGLRWSLSARTGARAARAAAEERVALGELDELALAVAREVRDAHAALATAVETVRLTEAAVGAAEEAYRIVAAAQDAGGATVTDVLEAENARREALVRAVAARAEHELARARLVAATGGIR